MSYRFKSIISFFCEHYNVRNGNCFLPCVKYKSYCHCFTAIKFAKPSWRSLQSMIPFIANPTELVGAMPLHLACARPLCRLKAPLGLSLLRKRGLYVLSAAVEGKNRPVATNFQFLKMLCSTGTSLLKLLRVFQVILSGRACPKPCYESEKKAEKIFHGNQYTLAKKSGGSHDDTHHSGKKTCDRIAEENGVSRASVLRARHYTKGVDIADTDIPSPRKTAILFNWMTSSSENTL